MNIFYFYYESDQQILNKYLQKPQRNLLEGFFEAFANIYSEFADQIHNRNKKYSFPTIDDGVAGIKFIYAAKKSSNLNSKWIKI